MCRFSRDRISACWCCISLLLFVNDSHWNCKCVGISTCTLIPEGGCLFPQRWRCISFPQGAFYQSGSQYLLSIHAYMFSSSLIYSARAWPSRYDLFACNRININFSTRIKYFYVFTPWARLSRKFLSAVRSENSFH